MSSFVNCEYYNLDRLYLNLDWHTYTTESCGVVRHQTSNVKRQTSNVKG